MQSNGVALPSAQPQPQQQSQQPQPQPPPSQPSASPAPPKSASVIFNSQPGLPPAHPLASNPHNPVVFFDLTIAGHAQGRIIMELFADVSPRTAENFRQFCTGEYRPHGVPLGYKGCEFHRIIKDFCCQSGDTISRDGTGCTSIYAGKQFEDENFTLKHTKAGLITMANTGPNTNGCQFLILTQPAQWLDDRHTVFGCVIDGMLTVRKIENVGVGAQNKPKLPVVIAQCGEL